MRQQPNRYGFVTLTLLIPPMQGPLTRFLIALSRQATGGEVSGIAAASFGAVETMGEADAVAAMSASLGRSLSRSPIALAKRA